MFAQTTPDSVRTDSVRTDSVRTDSVRTDSVKSPIARAPRPIAPDVEGRRVVWDREAIFASGALTLPELLAQVPGVVSFNAGFIAAPTVASWYGDPGRIRVFLDGVALDPLDPREGGVRDLAVVQIWSLEEVAVERMAGELRVHLRSWRVRITTPQTRTDIVTGSENTNLYRGFFGKRTPGGGVIQVAAQQYSTTSPRTAGDGDALGAFTRVGIARGKVTVDGVLTRFSRTRLATRRNLISGTSGTYDPAAIARFTGSDASAYLRAAWGDPDTTGFWAQVVAATLQHGESGDTTSAAADTVVSQSQYVVTFGLTRWGARLAAGARLRAQGAELRFSPELRASWARRWASASAALEQGGPDSTSRVDLLVLLTPRPWLQLVGAHSIHAPEDELTAGPARSSSRGEIAVQLYERWIRAAIVQRSASQAIGMPVFDPLYVAAPIAASTALEVGLAGKVRGPFSFAWRGIRWSEQALYRPQVETYAELRVSTGFAKRLTRGNFNLSGAVIHEYRGTVRFPDGIGTRSAQGEATFGGLLEISIGDARIFWYNRNAVGTVYETVPGYLMPRLVQLYGVRWEFWN